MPHFGVGSNGIQPMLSNQISGQACALRLNTLYQPSESSCPGVKPTATLDGIPSVRAITANVAANCSQ